MVLATVGNPAILTVVKLEHVRKAALKEVQAGKAGKDIFCKE
jgi:hypothetical protein